jgi:hypothetical protein
MKHLLTGLAAALLAAVVILSCVSDDHEASEGTSRSDLQLPCAVTHTCGRRPDAHSIDATPAIDAPRLSDARASDAARIPDAGPTPDAPRIPDAAPPPDAPRLADARPPADAPRLADARPAADAPRLADAKPAVDAGVCSLLGQSCGSTQPCCTGYSCNSPTGTSCLAGETDCTCTTIVP